MNEPSMVRIIAEHIIKELPEGKRNYHIEDYGRDTVCIRTGQFRVLGLATTIAVITAARYPYTVLVPTLDTTQEVYVVVDRADSQFLGRELCKAIESDRWLYPDQIPPMGWDTPTYDGQNPDKGWEEPK